MTTVRRTQMTTYEDAVDPYPPYDKVGSGTVGYAFRLLAHCGMPLAARKYEGLSVAEVPAHPHQMMTPYRLAHYLSYWFRPQKELRFTTFENVDPKVDQVVCVDPIDYWAVCSHHMLPFFGKIYFGYIPKDKLIGLSMIPLLAKEFCARPWVQEHMTQRLADILIEKSDPLALGLVTVGTHTCQMLDLQGPPVPKMTFSVMYGKFKESDRARAEFLKLSGIDKGGV